MIKKTVPPLLLLLLTTAISAAGQTTYTTTQDGCGGKALQYCTLQATDGNSSDGPFDIIVDNSIYGGRLTIQQGAYPNQVNLVAVTGTYAGFGGNPDTSRNPFYGVGSFESTDGTVSATFQFSAYYVSTCSGRGCGGALGWHYRILAGSTMTRQ